ncbi:hypothetical protein evm_002263 [Chilo suppressalis]|nr:hypothetical protein evm_002263 [Chilo suppressalis]
MSVRREIDRAKPGVEKGRQHVPTCAFVNYIDGNICQRQLDDTEKDNLYETQGLLRVADFVQFPAVTVNGAIASRPRVDTQRATRRPHGDLHLPTNVSDRQPVHQQADIGPVPSHTVPSQ